MYPYSLSPPGNRKLGRGCKKHRENDRPHHAHAISNVPEHRGDPEDAFRERIICAVAADEEEGCWDGEGDLADNDGCVYEGVGRCNSISVWASFVEVRPGDRQGQDRDTSLQTNKQSQ